MIFGSTARVLAKCKLEYYKISECVAHLVLPLKLSPHGSELDIRTGGRADVVHDVDVDIIQHHHVPVGVAGGLVDYVAKDGSRLCGGHLDVRPAAQQPDLINPGMAQAQAYRKPFFLDRWPRLPHPPGTAKDAVHIVSTCSGRRCAGNTDGALSSHVCKQDSVGPAPRGPGESLRPQLQSDHGKVLREPVLAFSLPSLVACFAARTWTCT